MSSLETSSYMRVRVLPLVWALQGCVISPLISRCSALLYDKEEELREAGHWPMPSISCPHWESWDLSLETVWTTGLVLPITTLLLN